MKYLFFTFLSLTITIHANAFISVNNIITPPDSTSTLIEKGTAQYLISEGKRLFNEEMYRTALVKFREALVKDKNNAMATYWLGECHLALGNYEKAKNYAEDALVIDAEVYVESGYLLGICYHRLGDMDKAIENYTKTLAIKSAPALIKATAFSYELTWPDAFTRL